MRNGRIIVVGGGPAGSSAAFHLARAGFDVTVIECRAFPRMKVCGEYISPAATDILEEILPRERLLRAGARQIDDFVIAVGDRKLRWRTPRSAWALSRAALDTMLLDAARETGATVVQPATVRSVAYENELVRVVLTDGRTLDGSLVVHADGAGRHDPAGVAPTARNLLAFKCHLRAGAGDIEGVTMRACPGAYVGAITVEDGIGTCAIAVHKDAMAPFAADTDGLVAHLWPGFRASWRASEWIACGVGRSGYVRPGHARSLRIGNAAAAVDPVGGEGIGLALWSGALAARQFRDLPDLGLDALNRCEAHIGTLYRRRLRLRRWACLAGAELLMRPRTFGGLWPLLSFPSLSLRCWYRMTGKPA